MKAFLLALGVSAVSMSCAEPKYAMASDASTKNSGEHEFGCDAKFRNGDCAALSWEKFPTEENFGSFVFKVYRVNPGDGSPKFEDLPGAFVVLWMPAMGHGSSPVSVEKIDTGTYRASNVFFSMHGEWEIRLQAKEGNSVLDQAVLRATF